MTLPECKAFCFGHPAPFSLCSTQHTPSADTFLSDTLRLSSSHQVVAGFASGLHGLTRNLALDLSPLDIRVNCVSPGAVETELWNPLPADARKAMMEGIAKSVLTARVGQPEEVAQAYLWFIKDTNVTGEIAYTDSGARYGPRPGIPPH